MDFYRLATTFVAAVILTGATVATPDLVSSNEVSSPHQDLALINAVTWGVTASTVATYQSLGKDNWLQNQLHPKSGVQLPSTVQVELDALSVKYKSLFELMTAFNNQTRNANQIADPDQKAAAQKAVQQDMTQVARQAAARNILRSLYAPDQLRERMVWFWFNHFNVHQNKAKIRLMIGDYEDTAIRPHALGRFRDLLEATLRHPAMLRYLDNANNAAGHINENYAREIMELHTMGVRSGYRQEDVEALARILTGVGIDQKPEDPKLKAEFQGQLIRDGLFEFNPARHDYGDKSFLGHTIKGRGYAEIKEALDILCREPATAQYIARKLATYFVADNPSDAFVNRLAQSFVQTDGDIASVLNTLFHDTEFTGSRGGRFKDPVRYVLSAVRLAYDTRVITNTVPIQNWLNRLGEGLFNHQTPDGHSMVSTAWNGSGQMIMRFEIARQIGSSSAALFKTSEPDTVRQPAFPLLQNDLYFSYLRPSLQRSTLEALDKAISPQDWNTLFLSSPEFMH